MILAVEDSDAGRRQGRCHRRARNVVLSKLLRKGLPEKVIVQKNVNYSRKDYA